MEMTRILPIFYNDIKLYYFSDYETIKVIGQGAFGVVKLVRHKSSKKGTKPDLIKYIRPIAQNFQHFESANPIAECL